MQNTAMMKIIFWNPRFLIDTSCRLRAVRVQTGATVNFEETQLRLLTGEEI